MNPTGSPRPDAISRSVIRRFNAAQRPGAPDLAVIRAASERNPLPLWLPRLPLASVTEYQVDGADGLIPARLYKPAAANGLVLFLHGGGFSLCSLDSHDGICARLAAISGASILSVAYRLAPEAPFPAAAEDTYAAYLWLRAHVEELGYGNDHIVVAGDSAGGNLAAVLCQMARDRGVPVPAFQLLFYPATTGSEPVPSRRTYANGYMLTAGMMNWFKGLYLQDPALERSPYYAPAHATDLTGLPPALIVTAEFDPLRDEGSFYADRLRAAGVPVEYECVPGTIHGFLMFFALMPKANRMLRRAGRRIRAALEAA